MMWHRVAAAADVKEGEAIAVEVGDCQIALCRVGGTVYAFENVCPHAYALLSDGFIEDNEIECPLHAARFEIPTGQCTAPPADRDLVTYPVKVEGEVVFVGVAE
jgi:3-phenylpropionate/trans-cinnamate dioxygenase ferredoxin subunit